MGKNDISGNKRIAKNTLMLYFRMFITMGVTLYTSRVVLQTLGVSDYGIYSVVGGFVSMLGYLNSVSVNAFQRFMSFALGSGDAKYLKDVFAASKMIQFFLALIIVILAETVGLWYINNRLVIEPDRLVAANWVFHCSVISMFINIISIPYNSAIVSHERMEIYAYISVFDVVLKLLILYLLVIFPADKLIVYAVLHVVVSLIIRVCYVIFCRRHFEECKVAARYDKTVFKEVFSYSSWVLVGNLGFSFKDQFSNMILNSFFGTTMNAARGIAIQVSGAINTFASNFFVAISPQITKQYAIKNYDRCRELVYMGARYSFYLLSLICIPIVVNIDYILDAWLGVVPEYTSVFIIISIVSSLIYSFTQSTSCAILATGRIKVFQIGISVIMLLELPIAYVLLKSGHSAAIAVAPSIVTNLIALIFRYEVLKSKDENYSRYRYYCTVVLKCTCVFILCLLTSAFISFHLPYTFVGFLISLFCSLCISILIIYIIGIDKSERQGLIKYIKNKRK